MDDLTNAAPPSADQRIGRIRAEMTRLNEATYEGSADEGLAVVIIDGRGRIIGTELAVDVLRRDAKDVARAVKGAYDDAYRQRGEAYRGMASRLSEEAL